MRYLMVAVLFLSLAGIAFGQGRQGPYYSVGGFGSVLYPGTGHAPVRPPGGLTDPTFAGRLAATVAGRSVYPATPLQVNHPGHQRSVIVPYPVIYSGYSGYEQPPAYQEPGPPIVNTNSAPAVVINQNFIPERANPVVREYAPQDSQEQSGMRLYQAPSHPYDQTTQPPARPERRAAKNDDQPTLYLIAFRDHSIVQALGYWMEGATLHYVSVEHTLNQASLDLIDRDLSQRLNDERAVEFKLPPAK